MNKHYIIASQQPWGLKAFYLLLPPNNCQWTAVGSSEWLEPIIRTVQPRYVFFLNWSSIVSPDILSLTECVNFHAFGPGPVWHRGGGPIEGLLLRGYTETMVWAHLMTAEVDAGPVYGSRGPVSLAGTKSQILDRFIEPVVSLIREIIETEPEPCPQTGEVVTFSRLPKDAYEKFWRERA